MSRSEVDASDPSVADDRATSPSEWGRQLMESSS